MDFKKFIVLGRKAFLSIFFFSYVTPLSSQSQISFRQLSVKEGLSQNSAISISQDSIGFLWIGTQDGLNKYDGRKFTIYPYNFVDITKPNYSNLGKVYTDRKGDVWIIPSDNLLYKFDRIEDIFKPISKLKNTNILFQDTYFNFWAGTYNHELYVFDAITYEPKLVLSAEQILGEIYHIAQDNSGSLLISTTDKIIELDPKSLEKTDIYPHTKYGDAIKENFSAIVSDASGKQWIGTYGNGLYFRDQNKKIFHRISELSFLDALPNDLNILALHIDKKERLWVATYGSGLYMINLKSFKITHLNTEKHNPRALHYKDVLSIYEDYTGTLWFGSDGAGLSYYDEYLEKFNSITNLQTPENINIDVIRAITVSKSGDVWLGTSGKGLSLYEPGTNSWRTLNTVGTTNQTISSDRIMSLLIDSEEDLWIGTQGGGLNILDKNGDIAKYSNTSTPKLSAHTLWCIFKDNNNMYWLGTREHGLIQFDKKRGEIKKYTISDSLPSNNIRAIANGKDNQLWLGTEEDGIVLFDIKKQIVTAYNFRPNSNSLSNNKIKSLYYDTKGILWVGTNGGGLNAFDIEKNYFYNYTVADGLANNVIYAIQPDKKGNLWLSSNRGITKFTPPVKLENVPQITNYDNYDGLGTEFNTGAYFSDSSGQLYFGGLDGFYWFRPDEIKGNAALPKTTITGFEVLGEAQTLKQGITLRHNQNTITFTFSSLQYSIPEKNMYQYKLVNFDQDWVSQAILILHVILK